MLSAKRLSILIHYTEGPDARPPTDLIAAVLPYLGVLLATPRNVSVWLFLWFFFFGDHTKSSDKSTMTTPKLNHSLSKSSPVDRDLSRSRNSNFKMNLYLKVF
jgi:hypothetical protein